MEGWINDIHVGDASEVLSDMPESSVHTCVTSPPYWGLRDYGEEGQIGLEQTLDEYIQNLVQIGNELQRVLRDDGSWWLNLGDTYSGGGGIDGVPDDWDSASTGNREKYPEEPPAKTSSLPSKCKGLVPHRVAISLVDSGWIVRNDAVWRKKGGGMPESVTDRLSTTFEHFFHFVQQGDYYYDLDSIREPYAESSIKRDNYSNGRMVGREATPGNDTPDKGEDGALNSSGANPGDLFIEPTASFADAHFAVYPPKLIKKPIKATCPEGGVVLDPFMGAGTTGLVADRLGRDWVGIDISEEYVDMAKERIYTDKKTDYVPDNAVEIDGTKSIMDVI